MKKFVIVMVIVAFALVYGPAQAKEWQKIRIAVEGAYPPFSFVTPEGEMAGFDIDIAKALVAAMGREVELVVQDWDGIIPALLARKYDAIVASMMITENRKKKVAFTNKYYNTPAKFVCKKGMMNEFSRERIKGKKVGVQRGTVHDDYLTDNYGQDVEIKRYATQDEAYLDLVEMFNKAIEQIRADGTYQKIQDKYFDFNVYGD